MICLPTFFFNTSVALREYKVVLEDEMRVDLLFKNIDKSSVLHLYLHDVDIILYINNIDN
jgi:hypothetical protein